MEWSGALQSVISGRDDIAGGGMGYTPARAATFAMTEPIGWAWMELTQKKATNFSKLEDFQSGKVLGTINGYSYIEYFKKVPWLTE